MSALKTGERCTEIQCTVGESVLCAVFREVKVLSDKKLSLKEVFGALSPELSCWFSEGKRFGFGAFSGTFCRAQRKISGLLPPQRRDSGRRRPHRALDAANLSVKNS